MNGDFVKKTSLLISSVFEEGVSQGSSRSVNSSSGQNLCAALVCKPRGGTTSNMFVSLVFLTGE